MTHSQNHWNCLCGLIVLMGSGYVQAQHRSSTDQGQLASMPEMVVYRPQHVSTDTVERMVHQLNLPATVAPVDDTAVIIRGTSGTLRELEELLAALDVAETASLNQKEDVILPFGSYPIDELRALLASLPKERHTRMAVDTVNRVVVIRGELKDVDAVRKLIDLHGEDQHPLEMQFFFLRGHIGSSDAPAELPKELMAVVPTLTRNGFGAVSLLAPMVVRMNDGQEFRQSAELQTGSFMSDATSMVSFELRGLARSAPGRDTIQLQLESEVDVLTKWTNRDGSSGGRVFELETTVSAKLGSYVVLAAAPAATADGEAIALVVRVSRANDD